MAIESVVNFVSLLRQSRVLEEEQLAEIQRLQSSQADPRALARHLIQKNWLTPYQVNQIFQGRGAELAMGQYIILERLGEGGMGLVFKARHRRMDRVVALKVIRKEHLSHKDAIRRFRREMQVTAQLSHPNIVMAYDADQVGETHFFVMEFVDGTDLGSLLKRHGAPSVAQARDYIRQAALGLQQAHEKGLVHRDIKPANLLVTRPPEGTLTPWGPIIKLLDLGVARLQEPEDGIDSISALTKEGRVVGTPDYMAPEQAANSAKADIRSDLYSLGCTFYTALAGQVPFPGGTPMEKLLKHRIEPPPRVEKARPQVPPGVASIVARLLAKVPEDRYQTPADLVVALDSISAISPPFAPPQPAAAGAVTATADGSTTARFAGPVAGRPGPRRWPLIVGAIGAVLLGLGILGVAFLIFGGRKTTTQRSDSDDQAMAALHELTVRAADPKTNVEALRRDIIRFRTENGGTPLALDAGKLLMHLPSLLDDLKRGSVPPAELQGLPQEVMAVLGEKRQRHWGFVRCVAVSPDSKLVASGGSDEVIRLWDAATMQEKAVLTGHTAPVTYVAFTAGGQMLVSAAADGTIRFWEDLNGKGRQREDLRQPLPGGPITVAVSPDGQTLAHTAYGVPVASGPVQIHLLDLSGVRPGAPNRPQPKGGNLTTHTQPVRALAFSANSKVLASGGGADGGVILWDLTASPVKEQRQIAPAGSGLYALAFSPDGSSLAVAGADRGTRVHPLGKAEDAEPVVLKGNFLVHALAFAADSRRLVTADGAASLNVWDLGSDPPKEAPFKKGNTHTINAIAFAGSGPLLVTAGQDTTVRLWNLNSLAEVFPLKDPVGMTDRVAFLLDDRVLAHTHEGDSMIRLWDLPQNQLTAQRSGHNLASWLTGAPDGQAFASIGLFDGNTMYWPAADGKFAAEGLPPFGRRSLCVTFSPDGKTLAVGSIDGNIYLCNLAVKPRTWRTLSGHKGGVGAVAFAPDGKTLASASAEDHSLRLWTIETGKEAVPAVNGYNISCLAFSPDGRALVSGGWDQGGSGAIQVWNWVGGQLKARSVNFKGRHARTVSAVAFTPDGELLISAGYDGQVILHGLASGDARRTWRLPGAVRGIARSSGGRFLATANANDTVYLLRLMEPRPAR